VLLTQDANGQFGRITGDTQRYAGRLKKTTPGGARLGAIQWVEGQNCRHLRGQAVTLQLRVRCSENAKAIRCGIVESAKTEDSITRDAISNWVTAPVTLIADYSFAGTPDSVVSDTTWQTLSYTATLGSSFNNLGVLIWSETALSQNATLDIEAVKLASSSQPTTFVPRDAALELEICQRYLEIFQRSFGNGNAFSTTQAAVVLQFRTQKRAIPTISNTSLSGCSLMNAGGGGLAVTSFSFNTVSELSFDVRPSVSSGLVAGNGTYLFGASGGTTILADAEL
jgi:hypothetical protein